MWGQVYAKGYFLDEFYLNLLGGNFRYDRNGTERHGFDFVYVCITSYFVLLLVLPTLLVRLYMNNYVFVKAA